MMRPYLLLAAALLASCRPAPAPTTAPTPAARAVTVLPAPASMTLDAGPGFTIDGNTRIQLVGGHPEGIRLAEMLRDLLNPATGFNLGLVADGGTDRLVPNTIGLRVVETRSSLGDEGYDLTVTKDSVRITAYRPAGLFRGMQTLRQLLPFSIESHMKVSQVPWVVPAVTIADQPRFAWRGAMLDVARHFFTVREVKQVVDILALYKLNTLHLHLSDDQGWRIEIKSRPQLALAGGATQVGGGPGGFYTQEEYADIVRYARERYVTIVPEIDMPGHINAALVSNPTLSCSRRATGLYTGTDVGWSTFCVDKEETYALIDDIVREIAALTPGRYFHMGGDEVEALTPAQYALFVERVQTIVGKHGKEMIGWEEIHHAKLQPTTLVQQWRSDTVAAALRHGGKLIVSGAKRLYLDMKYTPETELGLSWAGIIEVRDAYDWDPATYLKGVSESDIIGVEAPLWSETIRNITAAQYLMMPRLPAIAELGWTPQAGRDWESFRTRLAAQAPRWNLLGINYHRSPQIPW